MKKIIVTIVTVLFAVCGFAQEKQFITEGIRDNIIESNTHSINCTVSETNLVANQGLSIQITGEGLFGEGNVLIAQLSAPDGTFINSTEIDRISHSGILNESTSFSLLTFVPEVPSGNKYRVRIVSTNPEVIGADNGADITITNKNIPNSNAPYLISKNIPTTIDDDSSDFTIKAKGGTSTGFIVEWFLKIDDIEFSDVGGGNEFGGASGGQGADREGDIYSYIGVNNELTFFYNNSRLFVGNHTLILKCKNSAGFWSEPDISTFTKMTTEQTDMNFIAKVEDNSVRFTWNSLQGANSYKLTRDGYMIDFVKTTKHPVTITANDNPLQGTHIYKVTAYNGQEYVQNTSPEISITIDENILEQQSGTVLGRITDENGIEMDGVNLELRYLKSYNTTEATKTVYTTSEKGRYRYQGIPFGQYVMIVPSKQGYEFKTNSAASIFHTDENNPTATINFTGIGDNSGEAVPQTPDLRLLTPMIAHNNINTLEMNIFTFDLQNICYQSYSGEISLYFESADGKTRQCIDTKSENFSVSETKTITMNVQARTINLHPGSYNLVLRSTRNIFGSSPTHISTVGNLKNPMQITVSGEIPQDLVYWKGQIIDAMNGFQNGVKKYYSYLNAYSKFAKIIAPDDYHITGTDINIMLLSEILGDVGKAKNLLEMKDKATKYINAINTYNDLASNGMTEGSSFKLFCKIAGAVSSSVPLLSEYIEVLDKAHDVINKYADFYMVNYSSLIAEISQGDSYACISIKVKKDGIWNTYFNKSEIAYCISHISMQAFDKNGNQRGRDGEYEVCLDGGCGNGSDKLYLKQIKKVFSEDLQGFDLEREGGVLVLKIEWTNGRISYVPITTDFCVINSLPFPRTIDIEFQSKGANWLEQIFSNYIFYGDMANKIYLKNYVQ